MAISRSFPFLTLFLLSLFLFLLSPHSSSATLSSSSQFDFLPFSSTSSSSSAFNLPPCTSALLQMFQGKYPNGALILNSMGKAMNDLGNYDDCLTLNNSRYCVLHGAMPEISPMFKYVIGWCVPDVCDEKGLNDAFNMLRRNITEFLSMSVATKVSIMLGGTVEKPIGTFPLSSPVKLPDIQPVCHPSNSEIVPGFVIMLLVLFIFLFFVFIGSLLDYLLPVFDATPSLNIQTTITAPPQKAEEEEENDDDSTVALTHGNNLEMEDVDVQQPMFNRDQFVVKLLLCFSFQRNYKSLLYSERSKETSFLHGIRVFSMLYILLGHTNSFLIAAPIQDLIQLFTVVFKRFSFQFITGGFFAVDSFYYLSGFLGSVLILDILYQKKINWFLIYFHRWWRLTPLYFVIIWVWTYVAPKMIEGPMTYSEVSDGFFRDSTCDKYWWANILYLNNIIPWKDNMMHECMPWSWYLANDMQLFVITPLLLLVYKKNKKIGILIMSILVVVNYVVVGVILRQDGFKFGTPAWGNLYNKPWTRVAPYMVGVGLGLLWKEKKIVKISLIFQMLFYAIAFLLMFCTIFGTYTNRNDTWGTTETVLYYTFSRTGFVLGLGMLSYLMLSEESSILKTFLSLHVWTPLARLTYGVYLIHPIIMIVSGASSRHALNWDTWTITLNFAGYTLLAYSASFLFWFLVEKPFTSLEREVLTRFVGKSTDS